MTRPKRSRKSVSYVELEAFDETNSYDSADDFTGTVNEFDIMFIIYFM